MQKRNVVNSPRLLELKNTRRRIFIRKVVIIVLGFLLILGSLVFISRIKQLNITSVETTGNKVIDSEAITEFINTEIKGKYLWLFPKTNILLYPKNKLQVNLGEKFKRLTDINLSMGKDKKLIVSVNEREPEYTWCGVVPPQNDNKEICYFLDKEGYIFDEAPYFSGEVYFKFYGTTGKENPAGVYLAKGYFDKLITFKNTLTNINLKPVILYIEDGEDLKIYLSRSGANILGPEIRVKKDADFQKMAENLKAALDTEPLLSKFKKEYSSLEYIDLRFGNKVYYKFK